MSTSACTPASSNRRPKAESGRAYIEDTHYAEYRPRRSPRLQDQLRAHGLDFRNPLNETPLMVAARLGRIQPRRPPGRTGRVRLAGRRAVHLQVQLLRRVAARHPGGADPAPLAAPPLPVYTGGARQAPPEDCDSPEEFLALRQRWPPVLIAARMAEILADILGEGDAPAGEALGDHRDELARLQELARLDKLDRAALNNALHALSTTP